jgi:hypothetical protein
MCILALPLLSKVVNFGPFMDAMTRGPSTNPYEMDDTLQHILHWTSYLCSKRWKDMGSLGWSLPIINKWYTTCYISRICTHNTIGESWM